MNENSPWFGEPFVMVGEMRTCNGTTVAGGAVIHERDCPACGPKPGYPMPSSPPDILAGLLALTLDDAMQRLHNVHDLTRKPWTKCPRSTLCREAAVLYERPETQLALVAAIYARGELPTHPDTRGAV